MTHWEFINPPPWFLIGAPVIFFGGLSVIALATVHEKNRWEHIVQVHTDRCVAAGGEAHPLSAAFPNQPAILCTKGLIEFNTEWPE